MALLRSIATVGGFTMLSRITGLMREMMMAHYMGAGVVADAFFVAFRFPNLFRSLFAEGAFNAAFIPLMAGKLEKEGEAEALSFAQAAFAVMALVLALFVAVMELAMPWAMLALAPGFDDVPGKMELATELSRITFPYLLFISLVSLQAGMLNSVGRFAAAAGTPVLLNLTAMAGLWALAPHTETPGHALAWGTFAAGVVQFGWLFVAVRRAGLPLRLVRPRLTPEVRLLGKRIVPGAVGAGVYQVNLVVNTMLASLLPTGAVSVLSYADRLNQLPLGVVGIAIGTALLPVLSRQIRAGETQAAMESQNRALEVGLLLTVPAAAALMVIALPVVQLIFMRGSFGPQAAQDTALALSALAAGLPAYVLIKGLAPGFFAREDTATPVKVAMAAMVVNVALNLTFMWRFGFVALAASTAAAAWFNMAVLGWLLHRRGYFRMDRRLLSRGLRIFASAGLMAAALWYAQETLWPAFDNTVERLAGVSLLIAIGLVSYGLAVVVLGASRPAELKALVRRRK